MENQEILDLLNEANDSIFVTRKWNIANYNSKVNCEEGNEITYNTEVLKSNLLWLQRCLHFSKRWYYCHSISLNTSTV